MNVDDAIYCPECGHAFTLEPFATWDLITCPSCGHRFELEPWFSAPA
jgi:DNA-directed RNA polymerase subunit RPC12/RpoP